MPRLPKWQRHRLAVTLRVSAEHNPANICTTFAQVLDLGVTFGYP